MAKVVKPPHQISKNDNLTKFKIFLGGSIEMGKAEDWQSKVEEYLKGQEDILIMNPRRDDWDSSWEQKFENPQFYQQVNWEMDAQDMSDLIIYYFDPNTKSPITLLELGCYGNEPDIQVLVCCPEGYWRKGNVDVFCERMGIPVFTNLETMLMAIR